jgi:hypothetical protein
MPVLGGGKRLHRQHIPHLHAELVCRSRPAGLLSRVPSTLPCHQHPALAQQWRRVLDQHRQRPHRPGRYRVVDLAATTKRTGNSGELLRARGYGPRIGDIARLKKPVYHRGLSSRGFDKVNLRLRQSHGQREPRKPCTCADVRDPAGRRELRYLQPGQRVRHMNLKRRLRLTHGRVRVRLCLQSLENPLDLPRRGLSEPITGD